MLQVQIYIDKDEIIGLEPLHKFIMRFLLDHEIAGATSFKGSSGFGRDQKLKLPGRQFSFDDTPMLITFIDTEEKVKKALTELRKQYTGGLIVSHAVEQW